MLLIDLIPYLVLLLVVYDSRPHDCNDNDMHICEFLTNWHLPIIVCYVVNIGNSNMYVRHHIYIASYINVWSNYNNNCLSSPPFPNRIFVLRTGVQRPELYNWCRRRHLHTISILLKFR